MLVVILACSASKDPAADDTSEPIALTTALGVGEGELDPATAQWTTIVGSDEGATDPRDIGFDPSGNLWVANREDDHTLIVLNPGTKTQTIDDRIDGYALHFMEETAAFAFEDKSGEEQFGPEFGSCGESENTYNHTQAPNDFMGPALWSTDLDLFAAKDPYGLGSHLDMLHEVSNCVGLAWERDNVYWAFDGKYGNIVRCDFQDNHGVGQDDHSDGIIFRLSEPEVTRVEDAPGHLEIDATNQRLYVADTGGDRVLWIDISTGKQGNEINQIHEVIDTYAWWEGVAWGELVTGLDRPGGIALDGLGHLFVAEFGTGVIHVYDVDPSHVAPAETASDAAVTESLYGDALQRLDTGKGEAALYGIEIGPDGALWVVDHAAPAVLRLEPVEP